MLFFTGTTRQLIANREKAFEKDRKSHITFKIHHCFLQTQTKSERMPNVLCGMSGLVKEMCGLEQDTFVEIG